MSKMSKENKTCHQCWQYSQFCEKCSLGWCYWFTCHKSPSCAEECEAFNPINEIRKHRNENEEILPKVVEFFEFLQGISVPNGFILKHKPELSAQKAFTIIYMMQEYLHVIPDSFEMCDGCNRLFDSDGEGYILDDKYELDGKTLPKEYWGHWCEDCAPNVDFEC